MELSGGVLRLRVAEVFRLALDAHCRATGDLQGDVAEGLRVSPQYLSHMLHGTKGTGVPADVLVRLCRLTGDVAPLVELVGMAVPMAGESVTTETALRETRAVLREATAVVEQALGAVTDGEVTKEEARMVGRARARVVTHLDALGTVMGVLAERGDCRDGRARTLAEAEAEGRKS